LRDGDAIAPGTSSGVEERLRLGGESGSYPTETTETTATATVTDGGSTGELVIEEVHADADGDDRENLNDEYVVVTNSGDESLDLSGWTIEDEVGATYRFTEGVSLEGDASIVIHTGSGTDTATDFYWGSGSPVWNNAGDTVIIRNDQGEIVVKEEY